ncbi:MAG: tripartite tricarboxylate transporter substrate binding protein [Betaproteobacteria bacterium]|nr:tripartite tricarboxylate transporter substrate binding protein [Betaproteobacteria bacterium]
MKSAPTIAIAIAIAAVMLAASHAGPAFAQTFPAKPVRIVVPYGAGGSSDATARIVAAALTNVIGQPVVVENRPSATGIIGVEYVAKSAPDGYTLIFASASTHAVNPHVYRTVPYDAINGFTPISMVSASEMMISVNPGVPATNLRELIQFAQANPGRLNFGSNVGSVLHLAGELFNDMAKTKITHVPYKSSGQALTDLLGGQIQVMFDTIPSALPQVRAGKLRAIAVAMPQRSALLPDAPTAGEAGLKGYEVATWAMLEGPAGLPRDIVARLNSATIAAVRSRELQERFAQMGLTPLTSSPEEAAATLKADHARWGSVVRKLGLIVD